MISKPATREDAHLPTSAVRILGLLGLVLVAVACGSGEEPAAGLVADTDRISVPGTSVVLISVDTLRADRLPAYGYDRVETPAIDRLAAEAMLFEQAFTQAPVTLPAHMSMLTGLLPTEHGVRDNVGYALAAEHTTLATMLGDSGYDTAAFVSAYSLRGETGIATGFALYDDRFPSAGPEAGIGEIQRDGSDTVARAIHWLGQRTGDRPFFLFVHLFEPHTPYSPPEPWLSRYESPYDGEVAKADALVGDLLDALRNRGDYESALIIFVSDHGESLGEHGEDDHGIFLYRSTLRVPLLVKLPGSADAGRRVAAAAQLVDLVPTVLGVTGLNVPPELPGVSLLDLAAGRVPPRGLYAESYSPRIHFGWSELLSWIEYPLQYIHAPDPELYDLDTDPEQRLNLLGSRPAVVEAMRQRLLSASVPLGGPSVVDPAVRERLASLGYISGMAGEVEGQLADPKTRVDLLRQLKAASTLFFDGRFEEAVAEYESVLSESPGMSGAWEALGRSQLGLGRLAAAADSFETLVTLGTHSVRTYLTLGQIYLALERLDEAVIFADRAELDAPAQAATLRARVALARGEPGHAERYLRAALRADSELVAARRGMAELLLSSDPSEALEHAEMALRLALTPPEASEIDLLRGRLLLELGRGDDAVRALRASIEAVPENLMAYGYLAGHFIRIGQEGRGGEILAEMTTRNPGPEAETWAINVLRQLQRITEAEQWRRRAAVKYPGYPAFRTEVQ